MSNMVVRTNVLSLNAHRNLGLVGNQQRNASSRLSSGFRINSAADDAAGLGISENMRAQIRGLDQASRNAQDGISLIQTAEGALDTVNQMITRIRTLVVQASNDTNRAIDRERIQDEVNQLIEELDGVAERTQFNGMTLLDGSLGRGASASRVGEFNRSIGALDTAWFSNTTTDGWDAGVSVANQRTAVAMMNTINRSGLLDLVPGTGSGTNGAFEEGDLSADLIAALTTANQFGGTHARIFDPASNNAALLGFINTAADLTAFRALGGDAWLHIGANEGQGVILDIGNMNTLALNGIGDGAGGSNINVVRSSGQEIQDGYISQLDEALNVVTQQRSLLGAMQNRLEFTIQNLDVASENLSAAESRIRDADMAAEMMRLTQANVLQQAATAMLAQANQAPQSILQLLG